MTCPACGDPLPAPGTAFRCPAVMDRVNMRTCSVQACSPGCGCPVRFVAGDGRRQAGYWWHQWAMPNGSRS